jgi:hypothetical protein
MPLHRAPERRVNVPLALLGGAVGGPALVYLAVLIVEAFR